MNESVSGLFKEQQPYCNPEATSTACKGWWGGDTRKPKSLMRFELLLQPLSVHLWMYDGCQTDTFKPVLGRFARNLLLKWALPGNSNEHWLKSENLRLVVLSQAHSEPTLRQVPALGPPASIDTQTVLEVGAEGMKPLEGTGPLEPLCSNTCPFFTTWWRERAGCYLVCAGKPKWLFVPIQSSHFAIRKRPRKGQGFPNVTQMANRWGTPGRHKNWLVRNAICVFCCVFTLFLFLNNFKLTDQLQ